MPCTAMAHSAQVKKEENETDLKGMPEKSIVILGWVVTVVEQIAGGMNVWRGNEARVLR